MVRSVVSPHRLVIVGVIVATSIAPWLPTPTAARADDRVTTEEYVVAFAESPAAVRQAVGEAGGRVVDVNDRLGVALVRAVDDGFGADLSDEPGVEGVMPNHSVGIEHPGMPHRYAEERPSAAERARSGAGGTRDVAVDSAAAAAPAEPLASLQWDMALIGATETGAHVTTTGDGVDVGIIDTGIDAGHPDIAPNFDAFRSRNFTTDIPSLDGPCEVASCVDPVGADDKGHGTHVAGIVAAARNGFGTAGVAPDATLVNLRAGQDAGFFFLYETLDAITAAGDMQLDVVNMSFYTDPWLYNCDSPDDYLAGRATDDELAQQVLTRRLMTDALEYAHDRGVTMIAAVGNEHADLAAPQRFDMFSPGVTPGPGRGRLVSKECLDLPNEGPHVISVGSVGPSGTKADYSNYGQGSIDVVGPGGWARDGFGTPGYQKPGNLVLAPYPLRAAVAQDLVDQAGNPLDAYTIRQCNAVGACGVFTYLQGTSMATPHVVGVAALIVQRHGAGSVLTGYSMPPDQVGAILVGTASDRPCPPGGVATYGHVGRSADWDAACVGTTDANGLYGEGIVDAAAAVR